MSTSASVVRIGIILASTRQGRRGEGFARWIEGVTAERAGVEIELLDLRTYPLQAYSYEQLPPAAENSYLDTTARRWADKVRGLDAYVIVTPEYNHGYPGQLKNALDHVFTGWWYKPVGFVSYGGSASGARAVEQLRSVAVELRMIPVRGEVNLRLVGITLDAEGRPTDPYYGKQAAGMLDQLVWWARAAKAARAAEAPPGLRG
jgi:NAD(P)H-dependent FMN reductase